MENVSVQVGAVRPHGVAEASAVEESKRRSGAAKGARYGATVGSNGKWSQIKSERVARGLTLEETAKRAGVSMRMLCYAEQFTAPPTDVRSIATQARILATLTAIPIEPPKTVAEAIKRARMNARLTSEEFASLVGTAGRNVSRWERGYTTPPPRRRQRLFAEIGLDLRAFFPLDDYEGEAGDPGPRERVEYDDGPPAEVFYAEPGEAAEVRS